ncbi:DUF2804 domain-containing protein [Shewanella sp. A25]|nr:DUF2804 domain-containing protein [Shewanella shenzhenensis]
MSTFITQVAPDSLINSKGYPHFGHFDGIVSTLGLSEFAYFDTMDRPASFWAKHFDYKQFQFVSIVTGRYVVGVALADIAYLGSAFCYTYEIKTNRLIEQTWLKPLKLGYSMTPSPCNGQAVIGREGGSIRFEIVDGLWRLILDTKRLKADVTLHPAALSLPLAMCSPTGYNGWTYTQKHNGLTVKGQLTIDHEPQPLNQAFAGYDFSAGYMRRDTSWRWASINGQIDEGVIGLNLAAGVNETGVTENVFWINGERHLLGPVQFDFDRYGLPGNVIWRIYSHDGRIDLEFSARNCRSEKRNLLLFKSNFRQYLGYFNGSVSDLQGRRYQLNNVLGLTEDHYARW